MSELRWPARIGQIFGEIRLKLRSVGTDTPDTNAASENDGTLRTQLTLYDHDAAVQVRAASDSAGSDQGAMHVKLSGSGEQTKTGLSEQILAELKTLNFYMSSIIDGDIDSDTFLGGD